MRLPIHILHTLRKTISLYSLSITSSKWKRSAHALEEHKLCDIGGGHCCENDLLRIHYAYC